MQENKEIQSFDFENIYITYFSRLKMFALEYVLSEEDAKNIVQDVFISLWEKKEQLPYDTNIVSYLFVSTKNRCTNHIRHRVVMQEAANKIQEEYQLTLQLKLASLEQLDHALFAEPDLEEIVTNAIQALPPKCREIFIKNKLKGKKQKDIAKEMNISVKTVEAQMSIAYKKMKEELKEYFPLLLFLLGY